MSETFQKVLRGKDLYLVFKNLKSQVIASDKSDKEKLEDVLGGLFNLSYFLTFGEHASQKRIKKELKGIDDC